MTINESVEDYLEAILVLKEKNGMVRSIDVVHHMNYSKPSISRAMSRLRENGYITMDKEGLITLTEKGLRIAEHIYERHKMLADFLIHIGVDEITARADACKIEHDISDATFEAIKRYALSKTPTQTDA